MTTCRTCIEFLWCYLENELPEEQRTDFDAHLTECPECRDYLVSYRKTISLCCSCRPCQVTPPPPMSEELVRAILKAKAAGAPQQ
ncbi:hypothetical protein BH11PLA1_BH11PLA1_10220 [soil metagenome]